MKNLDRRHSLEELLARYREADAAAFDLFYAATKEVVFNFLWTRLRNQQDAAEVFQETYIRIHRFVQHYDHQRSALTWTLAIAHRCMCDHLRQRQSLVPETIETAGENASPEELAAVRQELGLVFRQLCPEEAHLLVQKYLQEHSHEEIAASTGYSPANVRKKLSRLIQRLRHSGSI